MVKLSINIGCSHLYGAFCLHISSTICLPSFSLPRLPRSAASTPALPSLPPVATTCHHRHLAAPPTSDRQIQARFRRDSADLFFFIFLSFPSSPATVTLFLFIPNLTVLIPSSPLLHPAIPHRLLGSNSGRTSASSCPDDVARAPERAPPCGCACGGRRNHRGSLLGRWRMDLIFKNRCSYRI